MRRFLAIAGLVACTGCVDREAVVEPQTEAEKPSGPPPVLRELEVFYEGPGATASDTGSRASRAIRVGSAAEPPLFSLGAGHGALGHVELEPCRDQGLPGGYLHIRVTFQPDGRPIRAAVESPSEPPPEALACVGEQLKAAVVPVFVGSDVTLSKSFFVGLDPSVVRF